MMLPFFTNRPGWQQHSSDEDDEQDAGGNSAADLRHGYRSILKHLAKYFTDVQELHPEDAREKAEGICVGLSEAGIGIKDLTREVKAMADEGVAEEEFGVGLMDYLKVRKNNV